MSYPLDLTVNGRRVEPRGDEEPDDLLIDFLHERKLTGTKLACGQGQCGACKVAVQKKPGGELIPVLACYARLDSVNGLRVTTVEGLARGKKLHPLQQRFLDRYAFQCGYSTPGMLMTGAVLIDRLERQGGVRKRHLDREIEAAMAGHVCRCTGYVRYHEAIRDVILGWEGYQDWSGGKPLVRADGGPEAADETPPSVWFRVSKQSRNDVKEKVLEGRFERPAAKLTWPRPMAWDACSAEVRVRVEDLRTGEPARDLNLARFLFVGVREIVFTLEKIEPAEALAPGGVLPAGTTVPLTVSGRLQVGGTQVPVSADVAATAGRDTLIVQSRRPARVALGDLGLPLATFTREFGLSLGHEVEFGLNDIELEYTRRES